MKWLDNLAEKSIRKLARNSARRSFLAKLSAGFTGGATFPLLPVARASSGTNNYPGVGNQNTGNSADPGDPTNCDYWRYCAIDGFLCSCCGGSANSCPPGTEMSPMTWIGTCRNPADGKNYIISYNDCCGRTSCGRCMCNRNEGDIPVYRPPQNNDTNWCLGTKSNVYNCSTGVVLGIALE